MKLLKKCNIFGGFGRKQYLCNLNLKTKSS